MKEKRILYFALGVLGVVSVGAVSIGDDGVRFPDESLQIRAAAGPWSQLLDSTDGEADGCNSSRFKCVMNDEAVLDMETGLLWQRNVPQGTAAWSGAVDLCYLEATGGRRGWRTPTASEFTSLFDPGQSDPALPPNHPFTNVTQTLYWTATTDHLNTAGAWTIVLSSGVPAFTIKVTANGWWCVRGGGSQTSFTSQPNS